MNFEKLILDEIYKLLKNIHTIYDSICIKLKNKILFGDINKCDKAIKKSKKGIM